MVDVGPTISEIVGQHLVFVRQPGQFRDCKENIDGNNHS